MTARDQILRWTYSVCGGNPKTPKPPQNAETQIVPKCFFAPCAYDDTLALHIVAKPLFDISIGGPSNWRRKIRFGVSAFSVFLVFSVFGMLV